MALNTTAATWVTGTVVTAAQLNLEVRDAVNGIQAAWTAYTPTLIGITIGNGLVSAAYMRVGKTIDFRFTLTLGTTTTLAAGSNGFTLPVAVNGYRVRFLAEGLDTGTNGYPLLTRLVTGSSTNVEFVYRTTAGLVDALVTASVPWASGSTDVFTAFGTYETA